MSVGRKILMVFDMPYSPEPAEDFRKLVKINPDYRDEKDVLNALEKLRYNVTLFGVHHDLTKFVNKLKEEKWGLVFVMCESFRNDRSLSPHIVSLLEMTGVKYTGANSTNLQICRDKALTKKILDYHGILVPQFRHIRSTQSSNSLFDFPFPAIVKPVDLEASEGITCKSVVNSPEEALKRAAFIEKKWRTGVIIEEYIKGRELYVGVVGNKKIEIFPPQELKFGRLAPSVPRIASYRIKWDKNYKKSLGIDSAKAAAIDHETRERLSKICKAIYQRLELQGYARLDLRMTDDGKIYLIEANPNPAINREDDFAASAKNGGLAYVDLIAKIVKLGIAA